MGRCPLPTEIFSDGNSLMYLRWDGQPEETGSFDSEDLMEKYRFDGIVLSRKMPLCAYLDSRPERFVKVAEADGAVYYRVEDR